MSISVSVLSGPSRTGILLMAIVPTFFITVGIVAFLQFFGNFVDVCIAIGGALLAIGHCDVLRRRCRKVRLTISDAGQISLIPQGRKGFAEAGEADGAEIVRMMPGSTLWPFFILLRLQQQNKQITTVPFFLYSLSPQSFRRLSIACRWIAARNDAAPSHSQANASPY
jgi:toxin CptA